MSENEVKIAEMAGDIKAMNQKLDSCISSVDKLTAGIGGRVQDHGEQLAGLEVKVSSIRDYVSSVHRELKRHIESHWGWVAVVIGLITIGGIILKSIK